MTERKSRFVLVGIFLYGVIITVAFSGCSKEPEPPQQVVVQPAPVQEVIPPPVVTPTPVVIPPKITMEVEMKNLPVPVQAPPVPAPTKEVNPPGPTPAAVEIERIKAEAAVKIAQINADAAKTVPPVMVQPPQPIAQIAAPCDAVNILALTKQLQEKDRKYNYTVTCNPDGSFKIEKHEFKPSNNNCCSGGGYPLYAGVPIVSSGLYVAAGAYQPMVYAGAGSYVTAYDATWQAWGGGYVSAEQLRERSRPIAPTASQVGRAPQPANTVGTAVPRGEVGAYNPPSRRQ